MNENIFETLKKIQLALKGRKLNLSNEKLLQNDLAKAFDDFGLGYEKEVKIDENNIVDFMVDAVAIEVKIKSKVSSMSIYRQLERYSKNDRVEAILLMTSKTMSLPNDINGKPVYILSLGRTQL